jgi:hypothetical protein
VTSPTIPGLNDRPVQIHVLRSRATLAAIVGLVACGLGLVVNREQFFRSYLVAFLFWLGVGIGCQSVLMIHHMTGGRWGLVIRRFLEAGTRVLRLSWVLFLPLLLGLKTIYSWADPSRILDHELAAAVAHKHAYLNVPFFLGRAVFYFAVWALLAHVLNRWSAELDATGGDLKIGRRLRGVSGAGLVLMGLTITFASVDWAMSLDPTWFSTIYGILFMVGQTLSAFSLVLMLVAWMGEERPLASVVSREAAHDLGKLYFAFIMLWAYIAVSQLIIVWSGNLPEEITWYVRRSQGGWQLVAAFLILFHFVAPFLLLLSRDLKRNARLLGGLAMGLFVARIVDLYWLVGPELSHGGPLRPHWLDLAALVGVGGAWLLVFAAELEKRPLLPIGEPELRDALEGAA